MSETLNLDSLDAAQRAALQRLIVTLADSKRLMGIRYSDWLIGAPSIETGIAASSMCQDEWGHARLLYAMLKSLDVDPQPLERERPAEEFASVAPLDAEMPDWAAVVAAIVFVDGAISAVLRSFADGSFDAAQGRVPKMLAEEEFHSSLGSAWFKRLAAAEGEAHACLKAATESMLPALLAWVGADDSAARSMVALGVLAPAAERVTDFRGAVRDHAALVGVDVDGVAASTEWDEQRGRTVGHPDQDSVERARGDRNRALFVE